MSNERLPYRSSELFISGQWTLCMSSRRIILNTSATYIRSIIAAGLGVFSARWVFAGLGASDYGLFAVVGSVIFCITILNGLMAGSASRHFAFAVGRGDSDEAQKWFNTSLCIHLILPVVLISMGWPIGEYCIRHVFTIPIDRIPVCLWVFRLSLLVALSSMVSVPYFAMFWAKQRITELAVWGTLQSALSFVLAYILTRVSGDRLLFFAGCSVSISVVFQVIPVMRARHIFRECRINYRQWFDSRRFNEILSFAGWNVISSFGGILRDQGSVILLNVHFGPRVNAAFGIANTVSTYTSQLGIAMTGAFSPEIIAREGRRDRKRMLSLSQRASKFGTILVLLFAIPIMVEMDYILKLWLIEPPPHTALFCQLIMAAFVLDRLSTGHMMAVYAYGKIAACQATVGACLILTLPLAWIFLKLGAPPTSVGIAFIVTMAAVSAGRVFWARRLLDVPVRSWLREVALPSVTVTLASLSAVMVPRWLLSPSFSRLAIVAIVGVVSTLFTAWFLALDANERGFVKQNVRRLSDKIVGGSRCCPV
jgi:O-antigen/teichoic acid export membrane protein